MFRNILSNAVKFTPIDGTVTVRLSLVSSANQLRPSQLLVEVTDSGVGLTAENQSKLFTNIIQFNANVQQGGGGSGLGLWISN